MLLRAFDSFSKSETSSGLLLIFSAIAAMIAANSAFSGAYESVLGAYLTIEIGGEGLSKPLILWINDGLMAVFFFLIGLELKKELLEGKLKNPRDVFLPGMAANGSMNCFGTNLASNYGANTDIWLRSPEIDLTGPGISGATPRLIIPITESSELPSNLDTK